MVNSHESEGFKQVVEKIVFDEEELEELKIAIRKFTEEKIQAKQLKQKLLQSRGRIVEDISNFLSFCIDRVRDSKQTPVNRISKNSNQVDLANDQLRKEIAEKNKFLEVVAKRINNLALKVKR